MKRTAWLCLIGGVVLAGCSTVSKYNPFASDLDPKTQPAPLTQIEHAAAKLSTVWQADAGSAGAYVFTPAVVGTSVFAADADGNISRFDNGKRAWRISAGQPLSGGVGSDGKILAVGTAKGEVLIFAADTGKEMWKAKVSSEVLSAPTVGAGMVIVRSGDARIYGFDQVDGKRHWVYQRSTPSLSLRSNVGVVLTAEGVLAGFPGGKLVSVAITNGAAQWEATVALPKGATELERVADITSSAAVFEHQVCAVAYQGRVACFDLANGNALWTRDVSSIAGLDINDKAVYVSDDKGAVLAFDRSSGASLWKQDKLSNRQLSRPFAFAKGVAVADFQGYVHLLNLDDGAFVARLQLDGSAVSAEPQRLASGYLLQTHRGGLYAISAD
jgi:outer membrane protein assembly factor BamB